MTTSTTKFAQGTLRNVCDPQEWEDAVEYFRDSIAHLISANETWDWRVQNLKLWNREVSGYFGARTVLDIIRGMTVNGDWTMRWATYEDRVEYSLSHHDAPTGSVSALYTVTEAEREEQIGYYV